MFEFIKMIINRFEFWNFQEFYNHSLRLFLTKKKHPLTNKQTEIVKLCQNILLLDNSYKSRIQDKLSYVSRHLNLFTEQIKPDSLRSRLFYQGRRNKGTRGLGNFSPPPTYFGGVGSKTLISKELALTIYPLRFTDLPPPLVITYMRTSES